MIPIYNSDIHHRRSIRLQGYDYRQAGAYFVTICAQNRACLFGEIVNDTMQLNDAGIMLARHWQMLPQRFTNIRLDAFVVMPNHIHSIIVLTDGRIGPPTEATLPSPPRATLVVAPTSLGDVVGAYKSLTTVEYVRGVKASGWAPFDGKLWQRNYYEHIIRNESSLHDIRQYIIHNPAKWAEDTENPERLSRA